MMNILLATQNHGKIQEFKDLFKDMELRVFGLSDLEHQAEIHYPEVPENSQLFLSNALAKLFAADAYLRKHNLTNIDRILVDDSGLCVPLLNGAPGVNSAEFGGKPRTAERNRSRLKEELQSFSINQKNEFRTPAFFVCFLMSAELRKSALESCDVWNARFVKNADDCVSALEKNLFEEMLSYKNIPGIGKNLDITRQVQLFFPDIFTKIVVSVGFSFGEVSTVEQQLIPGMGHGYDPLFFGNKDLKRSFSSISMQEKNEVSHRGFAFKSFLATLTE